MAKFNDSTKAETKIKRPIFKRITNQIPLVLNLITIGLLVYLIFKINK